MSTDKEKIEEMIVHATKIHALYHGFISWLEKKFYTLEPRYSWAKKQLTKRKYKSYDSKKLIGHGALQWAKKFADKHPEILVVECDDDAASTSYLFLIPHENAEEFYGTTVLFVPQCIETQNSFSLEPSVVDNLIKALRILQKKAKEKPMKW